MGFEHRQPPGPWALAVATLVLAGLALVLVPVGASSDLQALWLAADAFRIGADMYPPATLPFTMSPPEAWLEAHPNEAVYPYLYPPLWAALTAPLAQTVPFESAAWIMRFANAVLLAGCAVLGWRIVRPDSHWGLYLGLAAGGLFLTFVGSLALMENQPQILVSFLILLSLERLRARAPLVAGTALALAAALKVYPVLFAVIWLIAGHHRAATAFAVAGVGLGGLSIALAGWDAHGAFLGTLATISQSVLLTPISYALTPALVQLTAPGAFALHEAPQGGGWLVMALPATSGLLAKWLLAGAVVGFGVALRHARDADAWAALWPAALLAVSLLSPLAWAYHYIPAIVLAPALLDRLGPRLGGAALAAVLIPLSTVFADEVLAAGYSAQTLQLGGTLALSALCAVFLSTAIRAGKRAAA